MGTLKIPLLIVSLPSFTRYPPAGTRLRLVDFVAIAAARHVFGDDGRQARVQRGELHAGLLTTARDDHAFRDDAAPHLAPVEADLDLAADRPLVGDVDQPETALADVERARTAGLAVGGRELDGRIQRGARMPACAGRHDSVDLHGLGLALHRHRVELAGRNWPFTYSYVNSLTMIGTP